MFTQTRISRPNARRRLAALLALALALAATAGATAGRASASATQVSILEDETQMLANPADTLRRARQLGAQMVRMMIHWYLVAPRTNSFTRPAGFNASDPAAYPSANWAPYDAIMRDAAADGVTVDLDLVGGAPLWATGPGMPKSGGHTFHNWEPSAAQYGYFVHAVGVRYSGNYDPITKRIAPGNPADLPRVSFWSIFNEPTYGPSLAPQALPGHPGVEDSPRMYRALVGAAWSALLATGHRPSSDRIIFGEITPRNGTYSTSAFGNFNGMWPLQFLRALYCVDSRYRELRGKAAALRGCPTTAAGSARFAAQNPGLFQASGFSDHPYQDGLPPNRELMPSQNGTGFTELGQLEHALDRLVGIYGSHKVFPIWITEYGYITSPPKPAHTANKHGSIYQSPTTAAYFDNWSEYLAWKNPRVMSFEQYLLWDPLPRQRSNDYGGFASGLLYFNGRQKPTYSAWRLPLYLPASTAANGQPLEVWGAVRPAYYAALDLPSDPETVNILFAPQGSSTFTSIDTVPITSPEGYFDTHVIFPSTGTVELSWTYPADTLLGAPGVTVYSRQVQVTISGQGGAPISGQGGAPL
jgi:hypothetical protein